MAELKIVNLLEHELEVRLPAGDSLLIPAARRPARAASVRVEDVGPGVTRRVFGKLVGLPEPEPGVAFVVSRTTAEGALVHGRDVSDLLLVDRTITNVDTVGGRLVVSALKFFLGSTEG